MVKLKSILAAVVCAALWALPATSAELRLQAGDATLSPDMPVQDLQAQAEEGHPEAQFVLGVRLLTGDGIVANTRRPATSSGSPRSRAMQSRSSGSAGCWKKASAARPCLCRP